MSKRKNHKKRAAQSVRGSECPQAVHRKPLEKWATLAHTFKNYTRFNAFLLTFSDIDFIQVSNFSGYFVHSFNTFH